MVSALLMLRRVVKAFRYAVREEEFLNIFGAGVLLVVIGTLTYALGAGWNVIDALYFAVATLTTTSVSDPDLVLQDGWLKLFTVFYLLLGIGILVEVLRRLAAAFVVVRQEEKAPHKAAGGGSAT
jgi:Ion channel